MWLQHAARPGDDGQGDSAPQLLQEAHQRRVGHAPRALPVHLEQDVPTSAKIENPSVITDEGPSLYIDMLSES